MPDIERKTLAFDLKATTDDGGGFEGLGAVYMNIDAVGDIIAPGAFRATLPEFLKSGIIGGLNHNWEQPIGHPVDARETPQGLYLKAVLDDTPDAQAVRNRMKVNPASGRATISKLSIGYKATESKMMNPADTKAFWKDVGYMPSEKDDKRSSKPVRLLKAINLYEVSPVVTPANERADVTGVKGDEPTGLSYIDPMTAHWNAPTHESPAVDEAASAPSFDDFSRAVVSANREFLAKVRTFSEQRTKSGRVLSAANRQRISAAIESMKPCLDDLTALLEATNPEPPKAAEPDELRIKRFHFLNSLALLD